MIKLYGIVHIKNYNDTLCGNNNNNNNNDDDKVLSKKHAFKMSNLSEQPVLRHKREIQVDKDVLLPTTVTYSQNFRTAFQTRMEVKNSSPSIKLACYYHAKKWAVS